jgi:hypothetical protein
MTPANHIERARVAMSAASTAEDAEVQALYLAVCRAAISKGRDELADLERLLVAREQELARGKPAQLVLDGGRQ